MKPMTLAYVLTCLSLTSGTASALDLHLGTSANVSLGTDSGLSLGLGADASADHSTTVETVGQAAAVSGEAAGGASASTESSEDQLAPVIRLIESSKWKADSFAKLESVSGHTYAVGTWVNADNEAELKAALDSNAAQIAELQEAISASASFTAWLKAQGLEASQVVAVGVTTGGSLAVFTN